MNDRPSSPALPEGIDEEAVHRATVALRSIGHPNSIARATGWHPGRIGSRHTSVPPKTD